jgi:hypothetical protein
MSKTATFIEMVLKDARDSSLSLETRIAAACTAVRELEDRLAQEQAVNAANTETLRILKAVIRRHCHEPIPEFDGRYDAAHPEEEHDGGLGSGDWMKEREA